MSNIFKLTIKIIIYVVLGYLIYDNSDIIMTKIVSFYQDHLNPRIMQKLYDNKYRKKEDYSYVKINENTRIKNKEDAKNAIYTFLDAGWDKYTVYCDTSYLTCTDDIKNMVENNAYLTDISNFVHPFNTFKKINTIFTATGRITFEKKSKYTKNEITEINNKIDEIYNNYYDNTKTVEENIKIFHDYIINNSKYDSENKTGSADIISSNAYGVLFEGLGVCSGYADTMSLFLEKMKIKNYRISTNSHVWNLVYVNGKWLHIDTTWDDPVTYDGTDTITHKYFLIPSNEILKSESPDHMFDKEVYIEAQ